jgi:hypothetical protein
MERRWLKSFGEQMTGNKDFKKVSTTKMKDSGVGMAPFYYKIITILPGIET